MRRLNTIQLRYTVQYLYTAATWAAPRILKGYKTGFASGASEKKLYPTFPNVVAPPMCSEQHAVRDRIEEMGAFTINLILT